MAMRSKSITQINFRKSKKAVFFTITAVLLLLALTVMLSLQAGYKPSDRSVAETRIETMNEFVRTVKSDLQRGLYISSFRAVMSMEEFVSNGAFLNSSSSGFRDAIMTGMISNQSMSLMQDSTFPDWAARINAKAAEIDVRANISVGGISIRQKDSWTLLAEANITINITDSLNTASWHLNESVKSEMTITGLEDPVFSIGTQGRVIRQVNATLYEGNYVSGTDTTNLKRHIDGFYYTNSTSGPSFLMRLEGNYNASPFGIESFVNVPELQQKGVPQFQRSMVDYIYFGNLSTGQLYKVNSTYESWFIIDEASLDKYQVKDISIGLG
ncbi:hypothetical protein HYV82_05270 [Candidatus Woesearchaeota archaeon]|nr:hypothetical protein [Candidatus Woesearchaeota archaeon]